MSVNEAWKELVDVHAQLGLPRPKGKKSSTVAELQARVNKLLKEGRPLTKMEAWNRIKEFHKKNGLLPPTGFKASQEDMVARLNRLKMPRVKVNSEVIEPKIEEIMQNANNIVRKNSLWSLYSDLRTINANLIIAPKIDFSRANDREIISEIRKFIKKNVSHDKKIRAFFDNPEAGKELAFTNIKLSEIVPYVKLSKDHNLFIVIKDGARERFFPVHNLTNFRSIKYKDETGKFLYSSEPDPTKYETLGDYNKELDYIEALENTLKDTKNPKSIKRYTKDLEEHKKFATELKPIAQKLKDELSREIIRDGSGSDPESVLAVDYLSQKIKKAYFLWKNKSRSKPSGAFFKYYHKLDKIDLSRYGIYRNSEEVDQVHNCLEIAFLNSNIPENTFNELKTLIKTRHIPVTDLTRIAEKLNVMIVLKKMNDVKNKATVYGHGDKIINIGLIDQHYFLIEKTNYNSFAIENYFDVCEKENFNKIYRIRADGKIRREERFIDSFNLIKILINKQEYLTEINMSNCGNFFDFKHSFDYTTLDYSDKNYEAITHKSCIEPPPFFTKTKKGPDGKKIVEYDDYKVLFFDFESTTDGKEHEAYMVSYIERYSYSNSESEFENRPITFIGEYAALNFLKSLKKNYICYAHNLVYDFQFLIRHLQNVDNFITNGSRVKSVSGVFYNKETGEKYKLLFKDSYSLITMPLKKFGACFNLTVEKEIMPYEAFNTKTVKEKFIKVDYAKNFINDDNKKKQFVENINKWKLIKSIDGETYFDHIKYAQIYCEMDVKVLHDGYGIFRTWILEVTDIDIDNAISIPQIANVFGRQKNIFQGCYNISGIPRDFIQRCVVGGRCMTKCNKKFKISHNVDDFDAVSLYPSAMLRLEGLLTGTPKIITDEIKQKIMNNELTFRGKKIVNIEEKKRSYYGYRLNNDEYLKFKTTNFYYPCLTKYKALLTILENGILKVIKSIKEFNNIKGEKFIVNFNFERVIVPYEDDKYIESATFYKITEDRIIECQTVKKIEYVYYKFGDIVAPKIFEEIKEYKRHEKYSNIQYYKDPIEIKKTECFGETTIDGYFIEIEITKVGKERDFPLMSYRGDNGVRVFTNDMVGKRIYIDKIALEDAIKFQEIEFNIIRGYYFDEGRTSNLGPFIEFLFNERLTKKKEKNPVQEVYKLIMNSFYGRLGMKPIDKQLKVVYGKEEIEKHISWKFNSIIEYTPIREGMTIFKEKKSILEELNMVHGAVEILSMSKRIMNEVMCLAEDNDIDIYYQDTDSMHIDARNGNVNKLSELYKANYGKELIGNMLGQFHSDFNFKSDKPPVSVESIYLGKKSYIDKIQIQKGDVIEYDYHIRMKGIPSDCIYEYIEENKFKNPIDLYENLLNGGEANFNLLNCCKFKFLNNFTTINNEVFSRRLKF